MAKSTFNSAVANIFNAGVNPNYSEFMNNKIRISNQFSVFVCLCLALPYVIITLFFWPPLTFIPLLGTLVPIMVITLNYLDYIYLSRVVISILPLMLVNLYHAYLVSEGDPMITPLAMLGLTFALLPFVLFGTKERLHLFLTAIVTGTTVLTFNLTQGWFEMDLDAQPLREGFLPVMTVIFSVFCGFSLIYFLSYLNRQSEDNSAELLKKSQEREKEMEKSQAQLKENLQKVNESQERERLRNWESEGLGKLVKVLRTGDDIDLVLDRSIAFLVDYIEANVGGIYLTAEEGDSKFLELAACYAYQRKKFVDQRISVKEGLLGQAYLERATIYLTEVPEEYMQIRSGTGIAKPSALLIVPMLLNDEVEGFIELASFKPFPDNVREFIVKVAESMAVTINTNRINDHTRRLLAESQESANQMRAQEEEMRQNMEELAATQEEMRRRESERSKLMEDLTEQQKEMKAREGEREALLKDSESKTKYIHLFQSLAAATNQAIDNKQAAQMCIDLICNELEWAVGHAYFEDKKKKGTLKSSEIWYIDDDDFEDFRDETQKIDLEVGRGLVGRAIQTGTSQWIADVTVDEDFPRKAAAAEVGLHGAFCFPVLLNDKVFAVLEFYSEKVEEEDMTLIEIMDQIGFQLSRVFEFKLFEEKTETVTYQHRLQINELEDKIEEYQNKFGPLDSD